jgi:MFS transporter, MHS family, proline/betaine transporter
MEGESTGGLVATFLVFGVGFVARPLGALILGAYGDTHGRKAALTLTIALMAVGTFIIGFAPPVWVIGAGAPILLLVGRLFQGFSAGGEIGGATAFLVEHAPPEKRAGMTGWLQGSMGIANALSALLGVTITALFPEDQITGWAWRIPFFVGLLIIPVGVYIRRSLNETEQFLQLKEQRAAAPKRSPLTSIIRSYPYHLLVGALIAILWQVSVYALVIYAPTYYASEVVGLGFTANEAFLASLIGNLTMIGACVFAGRLADRHGLRRMLVVGMATLIAVPLPALVVLHAAPAVAVLIGVHVVMCLAVSAFAGVIPSALARMYPVEVRSTGMAFSYNVAAIFFAGFTPALMAWATTYSVYSTGIYVALTGFLALAALPAMMRLIERAEKEASTAGTGRTGS